MPQPAPHAVPFGGGGRLLDADPIDALGVEVVQHGPYFHDQFQIYNPYADDATLVRRVDAKKRANSVEPRAYLPFIGKTQCKDVTANIVFTSYGERTNPSVTEYTGKDHVRAALNG